MKTAPAVAICTQPPDVRGGSLAPVIPFQKDAVASHTLRDDLQTVVAEGGL